MKLKCGLLGERLGHSYSKQIHACIAPYEYELYAVPRETAAEMIRDERFDGLNVTIPYKELAYSLCDELDEYASEAKSVNTIIHRGGKVCGYNTDIPGFMAMVEKAGISFSGKTILILGSGGTSKTAQVASSKLGAKKIYVCSRSGEVNYENVYSLSDVEVIVNTTPVGMYPDTYNQPIDIVRFPNVSGVVDVIYNPSVTVLCENAKSCGIPYVSGLYMLAAQAFFAAEKFLGEALPRELIEDAVNTVYRDMTNIVLIGMPGSGKSSIAKRLAELCGRSLVDTDEEIYKREGISAGDMIKERGEDAMRDIERAVCAEVGRERGLIIATGGGVVERAENRRSLSQNGRIYYIKRSIENLDRTGRPLSTDVRALYERRRVRYEEFSDVEIDNNSDIDSAVKQITDDFFGE